MNGLEETIGTNGFSMVFGLSTIGPDVFLVWQPLGSMVLQWFLVWQPLDSMVANHWSNDGMVTIHRNGLISDDCPVCKHKQDLFASQSVFEAQKAVTSSNVSGLSFVSILQSLR